jgi:hypothetical protein
MSQPNCHYGYGIPVHPATDLFPLIEGDEYVKFCSDIQQNGLTAPIVIHNGQLVDGRNRLRACEDVGVKPRFVQWFEIYKGAMSITRWIWSVNAQRRHLTAEQVLAVEVSVNAYERRLAGLQRQIERGHRGKEGGRGHKKSLLTDAREKAAPPSTSRFFAEQADTSQYKAQQALTIQRKDPELLKSVARGEMTLLEAMKQLPSQSSIQASAPAPFDVEKTVARVMRVVDAALADSPADLRPTLLTRLRKALDEVLS